MLKVNEEVGELTGALLKNDKAGIIDGIGDSFVTLIIEIKNRTGKTKNGVFIKD